MKNYEDFVLEKFNKEYFNKKITNAKDIIKKVSKVGKRETRQTIMLLDILKDKILKNKKLTDEEKTFIKEQGKDLAKILPLIAISSIPIPVPITPIILAYGKKFNLDLMPKDNEEPKTYKDKKYLKKKN